MANTKSAQKQARQNVKRHKINLARKTSVKTTVKKVLDALDKKQDSVAVMALLKEAESQLRRAQGKGTIHANTVSRKIGRLAKKVSAASKSK